MIRRAVAALMAALLTTAGCGCVRKIYIPVETGRIASDSVRAVAWRSDSVVRGDSVIIRMSGDTVIKEAFRIRDRTVRTVDTLWRERIDTVRVAVPVRVADSERAGLPASVWGWGLAGAALCAVVVFLIRRYF